MARQTANENTQFGTNPQLNRNLEDNQQQYRTEEDKELAKKDGDKTNTDWPQTEKKER